MPTRPRGHGDGDSPSRPAGGGPAGSIAGGQDGVASAASHGRVHGGGGAGLVPAGPAVPSGRDGPAFVDHIVTDPRSVAGRSAEDIAAQFTAAGYHAVVEQSQKKGTSGTAIQVRIEGHPEITNIQVHPGGGRHTPPGSPYWKISTSTAGRTWVVPGDFRGADRLSGNVVRYDE